MPFLMSFFEHDKIVYLSKRQIVKAGIGNQNYSPKEFIVGWANTACLFHTRNDRILTFQNQFPITPLLKRWFLPTYILKTFVCLMVKHPFIKFIDIYGFFRFILTIFMFPSYVIYKILKIIFLKACFTKNLSGNKERPIKEV